MIYFCQCYSVLRLHFIIILSLNVFSYKQIWISIDSTDWLPWMSNIRTIRSMKVFLRSNSMQRINRALYPIFKNKSFIYYPPHKFNYGKKYLVFQKNALNLFK